MVILGEYNELNSRYAGFEVSLIQIRIIAIDNEQKKDGYMDLKFMRNKFP